MTPQEAYNAEKKTSIEEKIRRIVREKTGLFEKGRSRTAKEEIRYKDLIDSELFLRKILNKIK